MSSSEDESKQNRAVARRSQEMAHALLVRARRGEQAVRPNQRQSQARQVGAVLRKWTAAEAVLVPAAQTLGSAARWVCQVSEIPLRPNLPWCCLTGVRMN